MRAAAAVPPAWDAVSLNTFVGKFSVCTISGSFVLSTGIRSFTQQMFQLFSMGAYHFCKFALIPQPLLPSRATLYTHLEGEAKILLDPPKSHDGFRVRATKVTCSLFNDNVQGK
jgi:hypothetical protein